MSTPADARHHSTIAPRKCPEGRHVRLEANLRVFQRILIPVVGGESKLDPFNWREEPRKKPHNSATGTESKLNDRTPSQACVRLEELRPMSQSTVETQCFVEVFVLFGKTQDWTPSICEAQKLTGTVRSRKRHAKRLNIVCVFVKRKNLPVLLDRENDMQND